MNILENSETLIGNENYILAEARPARRSNCEVGRDGENCYLSLFTSIQKSINEGNEVTKERRTAASLSLKLVGSECCSSFLFSFFSLLLRVSLKRNGHATCPSFRFIAYSNKSFVVLRSLRYFATFVNAVTCRQLATSRAA